MTEQIAEPKSSDQNELEALAMSVRGNLHLRAIIRSAKPALRKQVYDAIAPHLNFKPKPYLLLK